MTEAIEAPLHSRSLDASNKIKFYMNPPMLPSCCWICNGTPDGVKQYVDIGIQQDYYGAVYICTDCLQPLMQGLAYVPLAEFETLQEQNQALIAENEKQADRLEFYDSLISDLHSVRPDLNLVDSDPDEIKREEPEPDSGSDDEEFGPDVAAELGVIDEDSSGRFEESSEPTDGNNGIGL
jgi:hypothetical protein